MSKATEFVPREELSEKELKDALETCAREPIHIPGRIQPHGAMLVVELETDKVVQVSQNINNFINTSVENVIGCALSDVLPDEQIEKINAVIRENTDQPLKSASLTIQGKKYDAVVHYASGYKVIELEPQSPDTGFSDDRLYEDLRDFGIHFQRAEDLEALYKITIDEVRSLTGFARVKLYQFDEDWNGMVVAESRETHMPSYLGLNFPASDIPEQARKLYSKNFLRLIPDISYQPVDLYPAQIDGLKGPLDMSYSVLRSVSPIHIQYLDNINVKASMSISIMQGGQLWGLIACHNDAPLHVPYRTRVMAEILGHVFSAKLASMETAEREKRAAQKSLLIEKISSQLNGAVKANDILFGYHEIAMQALLADGLIIYTNKTVNRFGSAPEGEDLNRFLEWCQDEIREKIIYTRDAEKFFKERDIFMKLDGGFMAVPIGLKSEDVAIWFRSAKTNKVDWAGNPEKPVEKTKAGYRLTPRSSFELWQTVTQGKCSPWADSDIMAAESIAQIILEHEKIYAERANTAKTEFLSHMSHELRTPLGTVTGIIQLLNNEQTLSDKQKDLVKTLNVSANSLLSLVNDLLDVAKIEAGEVDLEDAQFSLAELLEDIRSMMSVKANEKNLKLTVNYDRSKQIILRGDLARIRQVLINLVNNALKFTEEGFVNILARTEDAEDGKTYTVFEVIDSGIGISEEKIEDIFKKFNQADSSITRQYGGTGLGLAISKSLIDLMGGALNVTSKEGLGSKFTISIPFTIQETPLRSQLSEVEKELTTDDQPAEKKKILLVEDYEGNVVVAMHFLQSSGYDVIIANHGKEAVEQVDKEDFDLVIMDVQMPIMDGLTATKIIKEKQRNGYVKPTPIMGMTANALKEDREKCLEAGMDEYVAKPLDLKLVLQKIRQLVGQD